MAATDEAKLDSFTRWLQVNGADLRGCTIKHCGSSRGFGVYSSEETTPESNSILMVVPLDLAITPMRVLQDSLTGNRCRELYKEGDVDDRFLMMLFLTVERLRTNSPWKPYIDMLPNSFGTPLWFSEEELSELKGTPLYRATILQKISLKEVFDNKVKSLVLEILNDDGATEGNIAVNFQDFLWANSIFWTRALNIPFPHSYVYPLPLIEEDAHSMEHSTSFEDTTPQVLSEISESIPHESTDKCSDVRSTYGKDENNASTTPSEDIVWAEGLVPGIDFCNHGSGASTTWEVDNIGSITGVSTSMYLLSAKQNNSEAEKEILINYGDKGNEELLYLYGFVIENNPDDYLMMCYPVDALKDLSFSECKATFLSIQNAELRWLLSRNFLDRGYFSGKATQFEDSKKGMLNLDSSYSWSGQRKAPSYLKRLVFPEDLLSSLRTLAMCEQELLQVSSMLEEIVGSDGNGQRQPSNREVQSAIWEVCGDSGALQMLVDLLLAKIMELEEGSGTATSDLELLNSSCTMDKTVDTSICKDENKMDRKKWSCIVYRRAQKELAHLFLEEAEHLLNLCLQGQL